ncbi:MAG: hypothetical protein O9270_10240 [Aquidulcibacter sp.]|jgi:hypothetical protein|uniref:hypothetical protein n=1 Tax=Aquidulcibacter sp. TaxID=2052990 RepID=UPI0022BA9CB9|nr:hypothetical protein [Aquidulcibacter sp.]MCE2891523.1 hypothetical protein [Hyphomonadaceae bacterium]MCZ8208560.1 hypothetical protein [Aquidulcibacter sp.]
MSIKVIVCGTLNALVATKANLKAPPINAVVLYETTASEGESGSLTFQTSIIDQNGELNESPSQPVTSYKSKFILVVKT